jgi:hypothetical protein
VLSDEQRQAIVEKIKILQHTLSIALESEMEAAEISERITELYKLLEMGE